MLLVPLLYPMYLISVCLQVHDHLPSPPLAPPPPPHTHTHTHTPTQFVSDGLFRSELNSFLKQELSEDGYSGVEVRVTPTRTEIIILATRTQNVLGEKGRRIRELTAVVQKRFNFPEGTVEVCVLPLTFSKSALSLFVVFG